MIPLFFLLLALASPYLIYVFFREVIREHKVDIRDTDGGQFAWICFIIDAASMVLAALAFFGFLVKTLNH